MMKMLPAPLVYVGPTLPAEDVGRVLPGCIVRPPIAGGDLYRDRLLRGSVFVILDGVFLQQQAVSPREIADVIQDGGLVVGASSLGALRAAECWPLGMRGIGSIYRLLRAGALVSDDEVAVAFDAGDPTRRSSVALVNVRYAVWRAVRERRLDAERAERIVASAAALFYADRRWPAILKGAGVLDPHDPLARALASDDLKRLDALRALRRVQRWHRRDPDFCFRPRRDRSPLVPRAAGREREHDAFDGKPAGGVLRELTRWLVASGRYLRYVGAIGETGRSPASTRSREGAADDELNRWFERRGVLGSEQRALWLERRTLYPPAVARAAAGRAEQREFLAEFLFDEELASQRLAAAVAVSGELDAELFRCRAMQRLAAESAALGLAPTEIERHQAVEQIVAEHECRSWEDLLELGRGDPKAHELFRAHRELRSRACAMRRRC